LALLGSGSAAIHAVTPGDLLHHVRRGVLFQEQGPWSHDQRLAGNRVPHTGSLPTPEERE
jgi:hypothetical protein